jgi:hypothetical protein
LGRVRSSGMRSLLLVLCLVCGLFGVNRAEAQSLQWLYKFGAVDTCCGFNNVTTAYIYASASAACTAQLKSGFHVSSITGTDHPAGLPVNNTTEYILTCLAQDINGGQTTTGQGRTKGTCPSTSTFVSGTTCACPSPSVWNAASGACGAVNACTPGAGLVQTTNFTVAWAIDPTATPLDGVSNVVGNFVGPHAGDTVCVNGCNRSADTASGQGHISLEPAASGLYRLSLDYKTTGLGTTCTTDPNAPSSPTAPNPSCPGFVGSVNGVTRCVPAAGGPSLPAPTNAASAPPPGLPVTPGNPVAGDKPVSGPGSGDPGAGRTPLVGGGPAGANPISNGGGNGGGSSSSLGGGTTGGPKGTTGGSGTSGGAAGTPVPGTDKPLPPCGAPGEAKCSIDETGTPDAAAGTGSYGVPTTAQTTQGAVWTGKISGATAYNSVSWSMPGWLPSVSCSPISMWAPSVGAGHWDVNPCASQGVNTWRALLGWVLAVMTVRYAWLSLRDIRA